MKPRVDVESLIGQRHGKLVGIKPGGVVGGKTSIVCLCDCGTEKAVVAGKFRSGVLRSCGCARHSIKVSDMLGKKFGLLTVIAREGSRKAGSGVTAMWRCRCNCGAELVRSGGAIRQGGGGNSCGCTAGDKHRRHGMKETKVYRAWQNMKKRCFSKTSPDYHRYGGRGITVCERWRDSFENFLADMGQPPSPAHTLDRKENNGNYEPSNCRWVVRKIQNRNKRTTRLLTYGGKTQCLVDWANELGINPSSLSSRLEDGWPIEKALTAGNQKAPVEYEAFGKAMTLEDWACETGISLSAIYQRLRRGWDIERTLTAPMRKSPSNSA
jgi:hypothetical protein